MTHCEPKQKSFGGRQCIVSGPLQVTASRWLTAVFCWAFLQSLFFALYLLLHFAIDTPLDRHFVADSCLFRTDLNCDRGSEFEGPVLQLMSGGMRTHLVLPTARRQARSIVALLTAIHMQTSSSCVLSHCGPLAAEISPPSRDTERAREAWNLPRPMLRLLLLQVRVSGYRCCPPTPLLDGGTVRTRSHALRLWLTVSSLRD